MGRAGFGHLALAPARTPRPPSLADADILSAFPLLAALAHDPDSPSVNKGLAVVYWRRGDFEQAWNAVVQCRLKGVPLDPEFIAGLQADSGQMGPE